MGSGGLGKGRFRVSEDWGREDNIGTVGDWGRGDLRAVVWLWAFGRGDILGL